MTAESPDPPDPPDPRLEIYFSGRTHVDFYPGNNGVPSKFSYRRKSDIERFQALHGRQAVTLVYKEGDYVRGMATVTARAIRDYLGIHKGDELMASFRKSRNGHKLSK